MSTTLHAIFDGEVLRLEEKAELELNARYKITLERESEQEKDDEYPLTALLGLAIDMGVDDLAANHDKYAHSSVSVEGKSDE